MSCGRAPSPRRGIALFLAIGLMILIGLLIAGAVASSTLAQRSSRLVGVDAALTSAADFALGSVLGDPRGFGLADIPLGQMQTFDVVTRGAAGVSAKVAATRLRSGVLWLVGATWAGDTQGMRRINLVARFPSPGALPPAAIVSRGSVQARAGVTFGVDSTRDAECSAAGSPAVIVGPGAGADVAAGTPTAVSRAATDSTTYYLTNRQLALLDSGVGVVHVRGDTAISGGSFDGILIVDGRLTVHGPFAVNGLIVAGGSIVALGVGLSVVGAVMSFAPESSLAVSLSSAAIQYAPCIVARAIRVAVPPRPARGRSWAELF